MCTFERIPSLYFELIRSGESTDSRHKNIGSPRVLLTTQCVTQADSPKACLRAPSCPQTFDLELDMMPESILIDNLVKVLDMSAKLLFHHRSIEIGSQ